MFNFKEKRLIKKEPDVGIDKHGKKIGKEAVPEAAPAAPPVKPSKAAIKRMKKGVEVGEKGKAQREKVRERLPKKPPVKLPRIRPLDSQAFVDSIDSKSERKKLDKLTINILREGHQINAQKWNHASIEGIKDIYRDCQNIGINVNDPFYKTFFAILANAADENTNPYLGEEPYRQWFLDPYTNMSNLETLPPKGEFFGGDQFALAMEHLHYLKGVLLAQDAHQTMVLGKQESMDSDPVAEKVSGFLRNNFDKFRKAIRERDYATAGMYAVGVWAIWRSMKELKIVGKGAKGTKWLAYGLAAYCGYSFAKNAGYDILKIAGFRDNTFEVKGTPLEAIDSFLKSMPEYRNLAKELDYGVVLRVSEVNLVDLDDLYLKSNEEGVQFIHPYQFPSIFPDLAKEYPFHMGVGEAGLADYTGMSRKKLSPAQREYIRVGQQLYKVALTMRAIYKEGLQKRHPDYKRLSFEEAIRTNDVRKLGKVRHLLGAVYDIAPPAEKKLFSTKKLEEARKEMETAFEGHEVGLHIDIQSGKKGHFQGRIKGYPVVFVRVKDTYRVYLKPDYGGEHTPGENHIAEIPVEGPLRSHQVKKAIKGVDTKMNELLNKINLTTPGSVVVYKQGRWECDVTIPGADEFNLIAQQTKAYITPFSNGKGLNIRTVGGVRINVDTEIAKLYPAALSLVPNIVNQKEFHALKVFSNVGRLRIEDKVSGDKKLTILVGDKRLPLQLEFVSGKFKIVDNTELKKILKDPAFAKEYIDSLKEDEFLELNKTINRIKELVNGSCSESFVKYFFKAIAQETGKDPLDGINFDLISGSIPEYFTNMVLEVSRNEVMERLRSNILTAKSLDEVEIARKKAIQPLESRLNAIQTLTSIKNFKLGDKGWERNEFRTIIDRIRFASTKSAEYNRARTQFEYSVYSLSLPGLLRKSDLSDRSHIIAGKLMGVFSYYTAHLDNQTYEYEISKTPGAPPVKASAAVDLDNLKFPPTPTPGFPDSKTDPALRGHYILNYIYKYVQPRIYNKAKTEENLDTIPDGSSTTYWDIKPFEEWLDKERDYSPLDERDLEKPFEHKETRNERPETAGETPLEKYMLGEFKKAYDYLENNFGDILNMHAVNDYLYRQAEPGVSYYDVGLLEPYLVEDANGNLKKDANGNHIVKCKLWTRSNRIARMAGNKRSRQIDLVEKEIIYFVERIFSNDKFFQNSKKPFFSTYINKLKQKWPSINL